MGLIQGVEKAEAGEEKLTQSYATMNPIQKFVLQGIAKFTKTVPQGANTQVFLAAAADSGGDLTKDGGNYFDEMKVATPMPFTNSQQLAKSLWDVSEQLTGAK